MQSANALPIPIANNYSLFQGCSNYFGPDPVAKWTSAEVHAAINAHYRRHNAMTMTYV